MKERLGSRSFFCMLRVMAYNLMDEVAAVVGTIPSARMLPAEEAQALVTTLADKYDIDLHSLFPWEKLEGISILMMIRRVGVFYRLPCSGYFRKISTWW